MIIGVRTGRAKNLNIAVDPPNPDGRAGSLQINTRGSVAWIVTVGGEVRVWKLERGSDGPKLLDEGSDIDSRSLSLRGTTLGWKSGGARKTAELN